MNFSIPLLVLSLFYLVLIACEYFYKQRYASVENTIYTGILVNSILGVILDLAGLWAHSALAEDSILRWIIVKFYMQFLLTFLILLIWYVILLICKSEKNLSIMDLYKTDKKTGFIFGLYIFCTALNFILPFEYFKDGSVVYIYGPNSDFMSGIAMIILFTSIFLMFRFKNILDSTKTRPVIIFCSMMIPVTLIQMLDPSLLFVTSLVAFVTVYMYHTIENPDMKMIEELNLAKDSAEKANRAKTDFLSSMSHEIRTPLNAIVGFSQALSFSNLPDSAKEEVSNIMMASDTLLEIINGILDISKIEADKLEIIDNEYSFTKIYNELCKLGKVRLGDKDIILNYYIDPTIPSVLYGDHVRVKQVILNILTNAIKYTERGKIDFNVNCVIKDGVCRLIVSVADTGKGIKEDKINSLFNKFERLEEDKNSTIEGTGLGLAITKKLVELMDGKIVVQSIYGEGSKFTIALDQKIVDKEYEEAVVTIVEKIDLSDKNILIVDDNMINLKVASKLLSFYNCNIDTINSGLGAIDLINTNNYDLVFMDDMMPVMTGVETFIKLKESGFNIPCIALTANAISGMKEQYLEYGFTDYLAKPIDRDELDYLIKKYIVK